MTSRSQVQYGTTRPPRTLYAYTFLFYLQIMNIIATVAAVVYSEDCEVVRMAGEYDQQFLENGDHVESTTCHDAS